MDTTYITVTTVLMYMQIVYAHNCWAVIDAQSHRQTLNHRVTIVTEGHAAHSGLHGMVCMVDKVSILVRQW